MLASEIILKPIITEKSMLLAEEQRKYTFAVDKRANKVQIKKAVEELFSVSVTKVHKIVTTPKKKRVGRYEGYKKHVVKAIVTLAKGESIPLFEA